MQMQMVPIDRESMASPKDSDSCTDETNEDSTENEKNLPASSLLTLLDEKNKSISLLKRQVNNQKLQLGFYLHKVLNSRKVVQLAESCVPYETEENIQVNLAMNKFCKQTGLKSRILNLHGRMTSMEKRILRMVFQQEDMVRVVVTKFMEHFNAQKEETPSQQVLAPLKDDTGQMKMLGKIFNSVNKLRREMETFRVCCDRLLTIEEERNALVEQVYSIPVNQRMSYGMLLAAEYEKTRLEKEVQEIKREQFTLQERLARLLKTNGVQAESSSTEEQNTSLHNMLETVNKEAITLLAAATEQKEKYVQEIESLKEENSKVVQKLADLENVSQEKTELETRMALAAKELEKLKDYDENKFNVLNTRLADVTEEKEILEEKLKHYYSIEEQVRCLREQINDLDTIRKQRDYFKSQVDDLQAIRAAYAQLVEHCPKREEEDAKKDQKLAELEKSKEEMSNKVQELSGIVSDQEFQIRHLLIIIDKLGSHHDKPQMIPYGSERMVYNAHIQTHTDSPLNNNESMFNKDSGYTSDGKSAFSQTKTPRYAPQNTIESSTSDVIKVTSFSNCLASDKASNCDYLQNFINDDVAAQKNPINERREKELKKVAEVTKTADLTTTSVEIQSINREGKSETIKAILSGSSPIEGTIEMNNAEALSLRLTYGNSNVKERKSQSTSINSTLVPISSKSDLYKSSSMIDDFELMKDSSRETVAATLPSIHHQLGSVLTMQCLKYTYSSEEKPNENSFMSILKKDDEDVNVIISKETMPSENVSEVSDRENNDCEEENVEMHSCDNTPRCDEELESIKSAKTVGLSSRLTQLTSDLDKTLSLPGGRDSLLHNLKFLYDNILNVCSQN